MASASLDGLVPVVRAKVEQLLAYARSKGYSPSVRSTRRTCAEQNALYAIGRTVNPGAAKITYARGCVSWHVLGRAADVTLGSAGNAGSLVAAYADAGAYWKSLQGYWGGDFPGFADVGHFEYHPGVHIEQVCIDPTHCTIAPYPGESTGGVAGSPHYATPEVLGALTFLGVVGAALAARVWSGRRS